MPIKSVMVALLTTANKRFYNAFRCFYMMMIIIIITIIIIISITQKILNMLLLFFSKIKACLGMPIIIKLFKSVQGNY